MRARVVPLTILALLMSSTPAAAKSRVEVCLDAFDAGQVSREAHRLTDARAEFLACSADDCPAAVRQDCVRWFAEVDASFGSVVPRVVDASGHDVSEAKVFIDEREVSARVDGWAIPVEPGPRSVRVVVQGAPPLEQKIIIGQGERNRALLFHLSGPARVGEARPSGPEKPEKPEKPEATAPRLSPLVYVAGGIGVAGLATFVGFGLSGTHDAAQLRSECGVTRLCTQEEHDAVVRKLVVADIGLGVGVIAAGVVTYLLLRHSAWSRGVSVSQSGVGMSF